MITRRAFLELVGAGVVVAATTGRSFADVDPIGPPERSTEAEQVRRFLRRPDWWLIRRYGPDCYVTGSAA